MADDVPYSPPMDCRIVHDSLREGGLDTPDVQAHAATCAPCRELLADDAALAAMLGDALSADADEVSDELVRAVGQRVRTDHAGAAAWSTPRRLLLVAGVVVALGGATWLVGPRRDAAVYPAERMVLSLGAITMALGLSLGAALRPLHRRRLPTWATTWSLLGALGAPSLVGALPRAHADHPASVGDGLREALVCMGISAVTVGAAVLALRRLDRRVWASPAALAWFAAVGSAVGQLVLQLHCPVTSPWHMVFAHGTVGIVAVASLWLWRR